MSTELIVPTLGESITEATVSKWLKNIGDNFEADEPLVEIETDKITVEVPAPHAGSLKEIKVSEGTDVEIGGILGILVESKGKTQSFKKTETKEEKVKEKVKEEVKEVKVETKSSPAKSSPSARKIAEENNIKLEDVTSSRSDGRINKEDVVSHLSSSNKTTTNKGEREEVVKMSKIRQTISKRLKEAQNTAAILTTFNEIDMSQVMEIRKSKNQEFQSRYEVKLGFMSFFVKAVVKSLQEYPAVNAEIKDENIIYKNHFDIGIAVGTEKGLVVPILKDADQLSFGEIETKIIDLSTKAKDGTLTMEDLTGGTFTISNGGVYGSMLSTPIINRPQSGILGMHNIQKRAVVVNDEIVIRPMMYVALSYDHRIIDGKESVGFLVKVKELLEDPSELVLGI
ncbi:2-oxoglutarate dehydrogenase complex dihydrolipoyllysine-residue succinyltransferase [Pelagibacteraceae bacterium]|nr:2-oxoglutarate dehydrogenase complex dihydrolipoyllysine-residue succinyltransferase [Pelagibacteraceae bacterium]